MTAKKKTDAFLDSLRKKGPLSLSQALNVTENVYATVHLSYSDPQFIRVSRAAVRASGLVALAPLGALEGAAEGSSGTWVAEDAEGRIVWTFDGEDLLLG